MEGFENVGTFDNEEVFYNKDTDILKCKTQLVYFQTIENFQKNNSFRTWVNKDTLLLRRKDSFVFGCLEDSKIAFDKIYNKIKNIKYQAKPEPTLTYE